MSYGITGRLHGLERFDYQNLAFPWENSRLTGLPLNIFGEG